MNKLGALALLAGAACGSSNHVTPDAEHAIDAPKLIDAPKVMDAPPDAPKLIDAASNFNFSCAGSALGSATATITVGGIAESLAVGTGAQPLAGVKLQLDAGSDNHQLATAGPTGSDGTFAFAAQTTGGNPLDVYVAAQVSGERPSFIYPPRLLVADQPNVPVPMVSQTLVDELSEFGAPAQGSGLGLFVVEVEDCDGTLVAGSTLTAEQNGTALSGSNTFDLGQIQASLSGTFLVANVPPGATTIGATFGATTLASHVVTSFADGDTETQVVP